MKGNELKVGHDYGEGYWIKAYIDKEDFDQAKKLKEIYRGKAVEIKIEKWTEHRTAEANRYAWVLMDKLAKKIGSTKLEVYREHVRDYGVFEILPVKHEAVERFQRIWEENGYGWICERFQKEAKTPGYTLMICYYGSSVYSKDEMSVFLDALVRDCEEQGIPTITESELNRQKNMWGEWVAQENKGTGNQQGNQGTSV